MQPARWCDNRRRPIARSRLLSRGRSTGSARREGLCAESSAKRGMGHDVPSEKKTSLPERKGEGTPITQKKDSAKAAEKKAKGTGGDCRAAGGLAAGVDPAGAGGGDGSGDGGGGGSREGAADGEPDGISLGILSADAGDAGREDRAAGAAGPGGAVPDGGVLAVPAERDGAGGGVDGDVCARGIDAAGEGDHGAAVRARVFGVGRKPDQRAAGRGAGEVRAAAAGGGVSLPGAGRPL